MLTKAACLQFQNTIRKLDSLILRLETNLGKAHIESPFERFLGSPQAPTFAQHTILEAESKGVAAAAAKIETDSAAKKQPEKATIEDFKQLDLRVGRILECKKVANSEKLYHSKIDIGNGEIRSIGTGVQQFVPLEHMTGLVIVAVNLKERTLAGILSQGMVMCATKSDKTNVEILRPPGDTAVGERIVLEGHEAEWPTEKAEVLNPKKKILEKIIPLLFTDEQLHATFDSKRWKVSRGYISSQTLAKTPIS